MPPANQIGMGGAIRADPKQPIATRTGHNPTSLWRICRIPTLSVTARSSDGHETPQLIEPRRSDPTHIEEILDGGEPTS